jgi:uncharacterized membrane protein HdeD (DUF308 family)
MSVSTSPITVTPAQRTTAFVMFAVEGVLLVLLGLAAIAFPFVASLATAYFVGWTLLAAGIVVAAAAVAGRERRRLGWAMLNAFAMLAAGILVLWRPAVGAISLTLIFALYLLVRSYALWGLSFDQRHRGVRGWWMLLVAAFIDLFLAVMLIVIAPLAAVFALGIIVGIDLVAGGLMLIGLALSLRLLPGTARSVADVLP